METMQNDRLGASFGVTVSKYALAVWSAPEAVFRPAEVQAGVVVFPDTLAARYAPGCAGVRERAPRPRSVAQSVRDHAPGCDRDTVRIIKLKQRVKNWKLNMLKNISEDCRMRFIFVVSLSRAKIQIIGDCLKRVKTHNLSQNFVKHQSKRFTFSLHMFTRCWRPLTTLKNTYSGVLTHMMSRWQK